mgnify:CR=1 FL=1
MTQIEKIEKKISYLPPKLLKNLNNYIDGMIISPPKKSKSVRRNKIDFSWEGALKNLRKKYTSVELQKDINNY